VLKKLLSVVGEHIPQRHTAGDANGFIILCFISSLQRSCAEARGGQWYAVYIPSFINQYWQQSVSLVKCRSHNFTVFYEKLLKSCANLDLVTVNMPFDALHAIESFQNNLIK